MKLQKIQRVVFASLILVGMIFLGQDYAAAETAWLVRKSDTNQRAYHASKNTVGNSLRRAVTGGSHYPRNPGIWESRPSK